MIEAKKLAYADMLQQVGDPRFTKIPIEVMLSKRRAVARAKLIDPAKAACQVEPDKLAGVTDSQGSDTIYMSVIDRDGNVVSLIQSVAGTFGSGVVAEGTGVLLQNRGKYFSLDPANVNRLEPRKRTMHTLIPAMAARGGRCWAAFGAMGADGQPQIQVQLLLNLLDHRLDPADAVRAPRLRVPPDGRGLWMEADYPEAAEILRAGMDAVPLPHLDWQLGHAQALVVDSPGVWRAGSDPRADGSVGEA
jgi:gamma-glutamyltranspeptidase/glutathione hydrolase